MPRTPKRRLTAALIESKKNALKTTSAKKSASSTATAASRSPKRKRAEDEWGLYDDFDGAHTAGGSEVIGTPSKKAKIGISGSGRNSASSRGIRTNGTSSAVGTPSKLRTVRTAIDDVDEDEDEEQGQEEDTEVRTPSRRSGRRSTKSRKAIEAEESPLSDRIKRRRVQEPVSSDDELAIPTKSRHVKRDTSRHAISKGTKRFNVAIQEAALPSVSDDEQNLLDQQLEDEVQMMNSPTRTSTSKLNGHATTPKSRGRPRKSRYKPEIVDEMHTKIWDSSAVSPSRKTANENNQTNSLQYTSPLTTPKQLQILKQVVLGKITSKRPIPLTGLEEEYAKIYSLLCNTITAGEGNSLLILGGRSSGKTALVNAALSALSKEYSSDFHVVRLNGFFQTDDKIALREIWRQLGREMALEEDEAAGKSYADTMATLLALLSHPSESGMATENGHIAKAVVFVMDEFDLFAAHPRQTLLYNLFDIAQSRKAPIAVLGLTTRIDVAESLEKRVKSRFSHRYVHTAPAKSLSVFQQICMNALKIMPEELNADELTVLSHGMGFSGTEHNTPKAKGKSAAMPDKDKGTLVDCWNGSIDVSLSSNTRTLPATR
jgi:origin recognition complex subunit 4